MRRLVRLGLDGEAACHVRSGDGGIEVGAEASRDGARPEGGGDIDQVCQS